MKRTLIWMFALCLTASGAGPVLAASVRLSYGLAPGQIWLGTLSSQSETEYSGKKDVHRSKTTIQYAVAAGPKRGWVTLTARILSQQIPGAEGGGGMDLSGITFFADMHESGEIRNIRHEGSALPPGAADMPEQMKQMMAQSFNMVADAWKQAVFWFPELPEAPLSPGDEFDVTRKTGMGGAGAMIQSQTLSKQVFTLEDVSAGLAYFSVKERSVTKTTGAAGGRSETQSASRGETVFDLNSGMWVDMVVKSKANVGMSGVTGMGNMDQDVVNVSKYEMVRKK
jgi:hypothetical protein